MDKTCLTTLAETSAGVHQLTRQALAACVRRLAKGDLAGVQIPLGAPLYCPNGPGSHYHPRPELFLQVSGVSIMRLTSGRIRAEPGGLLLVPRGVAHQESADSSRAPFCNLVFMFEPDHLHYHAGLPDPPETRARIAYIRVAGICHIAHRLGSRLYSYLNEAAEFVAAGHPVRHPIVQGLLLTHLGLLQTLIEQDNRLPQNTESALVARCRRMVQEQLADARLSVQSLASQLHCTPDYLSNRFHRDSGVRLIAHINQERCNLARHLLRTTHWNIKEVAARCGYSDSAYFSRVFSRLEGASPRDLRTTAMRLQPGE